MIRQFGIKNYWVWFEFISLLSSLKIGEAVARQKVVALWENKFFFSLLGPPRISLPKFPRSECCQQIVVILFFFLFTFFCYRADFFVLVNLIYLFKLIYIELWDIYSKVHQKLLLKVSYWTWLFFFRLKISQCPQKSLYHRSNLNISEFSINSRHRRKLVCHRLCVIPKPFWTRFTFLLFFYNS